MKTFSQFVNEAGPYSDARRREQNYGSEPQSRGPVDRHRNPFYGEYDPPEAHDKLHDTFNSEKHRQLKDNLKAGSVQHTINAYKKVKEVHGKNGFNTLVSDHGKMGRSRDQDEALRALSREK